MPQTFSYIPLLGSQRRVRPDVVVVKFGDGYEQRISQTINNLQRSWSLEFNVSTAVRDGIISFLESHSGQTAFYWTPPGGAQGLYVCREWDDSLLSPTAWKISASFDEVFE